MRTMKRKIHKIYARKKKQTRLSGIVLRVETEIKQAEPGQNKANRALFGEKKDVRMAFCFQVQRVEWKG